MSQESGVRSQESGVRSQEKEERRKKKEERRKKENFFTSLFSVRSNIIIWNISSC